MTIRINKETRGRFGNKIFHYNSMMQLSNILNRPPSSCIWEGMEYFENIVKELPKSHGSSYEITCKELNDLPLEKIKEICNQYKNLFTRPVATAAAPQKKEPEVVKLFDDED